MAPFQVFCEYLAIKSHFSNPKYDYFKYNKKVRATENSFKKRKDIYWFQKASRKYSDNEIVDFFVSNFISTNNANGVWIGQIVNSGERVYTDWQKRQQSLSYLFKEQSEELLSEIKLADAFNCSKGHPPVLKKYLGGKVDIETLTIYDTIFQFGKMFDVKLTDPVWEMVSLRIKKYKPFLVLNISNYQ